MKQIFLSKGRALLEDVDVPHLDENMVLVEVSYSFISAGTELAMLKTTGTPLVKRAAKQVKNSLEKLVSALQEHGVIGTVALIRAKDSAMMAPGYSCSGKVVACGSRVTGLKVGDFVACAGAGLATHGQFVAVPKNLVAVVHNPEYIKQASIATIGAIALQGIRRADCKLGEVVCVVGLGLLGMLTVQLAKQSGCFVIGIDINQERCDAAAQFGCDRVINMNGKSKLDEVLFATEHRGADATIITAATPVETMLNDAVTMTRRKGKVIIVGDVPLTVDREQLYAKEIDVLISCSYGPGRYDELYERQGYDYPYAYVRWTENRNMQQIIRMIENKTLAIDELISKEFLFDEADEAYEHVSGGKALGVVLSYEFEKKDDVIFDTSKTHENNPPKTYHPPRSDIKCAIVGAGGFAKTMLIPQLARIPGLQLRAVVDTDTANALNVARQYDVRQHYTEYHDVLSDEKIHAVVVATPHNQHTDQICEALVAGKAVFIEKPAAVTFEQYHKLEKILQDYDYNVPFFVDFNRSFSPFLFAIRDEIMHRSTPLVVSYRMNAGHIPPEHWVQSLEHGGRIIGEVCHLIELFVGLIASPITTVSVNSVRSDHYDMSTNDNLTVQFSFQDGSIAHLFYTALGCASVGKERMEVFWDGKTIVMDDYKRLQGFGTSSSLSKVAMRADKGHKAILEQFVDEAKNGAEPSVVKERIERILLTTKISLIIDQLARAGGGTYSLKQEASLPHEVETSGIVEARGL